MWSATSLAFDEKKIGAAGLSVRQRKLLSLLSQPASIQQLANSIALPIEEVQAALERFAKLGLVQSGEPEPANPMEARLTSASSAAGSNRMPLFIGIGVAALLIVAAAAWFLRSGPSSNSASTAPTAAPAKASTPTPAGPADSADMPAARVTPGSGPVQTPATAAQAAAAAAAPVTAPATPPAAAKKDAKEAAKEAQAAQAATKAAPTTAAPATAAPAPVTQQPAAATAAPATSQPAAAAPATTPPPAAATAAPATATPAPATTAAAAPAPAAAAPARPAAPREIKLVNRVEPAFPRGVDAERGTVRARLQVNAQGAVTGVEIVEANPRRVFDRSVTAALQQWRYEPTGEAFSVMAEISFSR